MSEQWKAVCALADIPVLGARVVKRSQPTPIAIFRNGEDKVFALLDRCPHKGGPLSQGIVLADSVACPLHGWNIEFGPGCATAPDVGCTQKFATKLEGGQVFLDMREVEAAEPPFVPVG